MISLVCYSSECTFDVRERQKRPVWVAIFVDGTPLVNTVPVLLVEYFQSPDDYNFPYYYATMIRWFRYLSFFLAVLAPGLFVALGTCCAMPGPSGACLPMCVRVCVCALPAVAMGCAGR